MAVFFFSPDIKKNFHRTPGLEVGTMQALSFHLRGSPNVIGAILVFRGFRITLPLWDVPALRVAPRNGQ